MKLLVSMHYAYPHIGGMENVLKQQIASLLNANNTVSLVTCRHNAKLPLHERVSSSYNIERIKALNFIESKFGMAFPIISPFYFLRCLLGVSQYDAVHVHDVFYMLSHSVSLAAIIKRKPLYITQHVAIVDHPTASIRIIQNLIFHSIGKFIFTYADGIIVYNINVKNFIIKLGVNKSKIHLIQNGIDTNYFVPPTKTEKHQLKVKYGFNKSKPIAIFVGRLIHEKGFDLVFNARSSEYTTLIVGNGTIPENMKGKENIIFFGAATQKQLVDLYKLSDVFIFPAAVEIFALVMQEAMACGLPIITYDNPHYKHYELEKNGICLTERNVESIKKSILEILNDKATQKRMSKYSRNLATSKFSWDHNYPSEYKVYDLVLTQTKDVL